MTAADLAELANDVEERMVCARSEGQALAYADAARLIRKWAEREAGQ